MKISVVFVTATAAAIWLAGYTEAMSAAECECDTAFQQCRKQYGCDYYYQSLYVRMVARTLPGGPTQGAGSGNPCATCDSEKSACETSCEGPPVRGYFDPLKRAGYKRDGDTDDTPDARTYLMKKAAAPYKRDGETDDTPDARMYLMKKFAPMKRYGYPIKRYGYPMKRLGYPIKRDGLAY